MPVDTYTNELMKALPSALRPNPYNIDTDVMHLVEKQWTPTQIVQACITNGDRQPGHVVTTIRGLRDVPPPHVRTRPATPKVGHLKCDQHEGCELCACDPTQGVIHHKPVPMPDHIREQIRAIINGVRIPD